MTTPNAERIKELREWLGGEYIGMGQSLGLCEPGNETDDRVAADMKEQMVVVKDLLAVLDEVERLRAKVKEQHDGLTKLLAENDKQFTRAETAEADAKESRKMAEVADGQCEAAMKELEIKNTSLDVAQTEVEHLKKCVEAERKIKHIGEQYLSNYMAENEKLREQLRLANIDQANAEAALAEKTKDYDWMMAQHDVWKACSIEESKRKKTAEAALAEVKPLVEAVGKADVCDLECEIDMGDVQGMPEEVLDILRAALALRKEKAE